MPKKPSTVVVMRDYPPLSRRRWYTFTVQGVTLEPKGRVCLELLIVDAPEQAGRRIVHRIPAILAPGSPLCRLLADGFGICLAENEPLDLATLTGRVVQARFTKPVAGGVQDIAAVRQLAPAGAGAAQPADRCAGQEAPHGLG
jgi:hypothetical protein